MTKPLQWIAQASAEEIGEALLGSNPEKAARVALYVGGRLGPELGAQLDAAVERVQSDPKVLGRALGGALRGILDGG